MALYMPHYRATLNDEIFAGGRKRRGRGTWRARKEIAEREKRGARSRIKVLLRSAFATAFASLLRSRGTMTNPRRLIVATPDGVWGKAQEKERKMLKGIRRGRRREEGRREGKEYAERVGVRCRVTITRRWLHGPLCKDNGVGTRRIREKGKECGTFCACVFGRATKTRAKGWAFLTR